MRKREIHKYREKFINKFLETIERNESYLEFINTHKEELLSNYNIGVWEVTFFDVFNNKQLNNLIKGIHNLNNKKYRIELSLIPKKYKNLMYLNIQYDRSSTRSLCKVTFLDDLFIDDVEAGFTQINNNQAVVEFRISFKKSMTHELWIDFIKENKELLYKKKFFGCYDIDKIIRSEHYSLIYNSISKVRDAALQAKLLNTFRLNFGSEYILPQYNAVYVPQEHFKNEYFNDVFLCRTYEIENKYLVVDLTSEEGLKMNLYFSGAYSAMNFLQLLSNYRMDFYYFLFEKIESFEIDSRINKYFSGSKKRVSLNDYKWLINKIRSLNDNKLHQGYRDSKELLENWTPFYGGKKKIQLVLKMGNIQRNIILSMRNALIILKWLILFRRKI
ncbi:hypothetical protein [Bacillus sonorensis]|uniref:Uncharacterized protein n=1 Tax=Bacillus sonorensis TaxID=119858 RepID=A0ABM6LJ19_9BACI|nr:hypothetical protein [Bacillus sonorensis]ASB89338.1 hypothetical protein S101395_02831 [Bacillus sonorensis]